MPNIDKLSKKGDQR